MNVIIKVTIPNLGKQIKEKRLAAGLEPTQVAADAGMSVSNLYLIESETAQALPEETLKRLSDAIGFDFLSEVYQSHDKKMGLSLTKMPLESQRAIIAIVKNHIETIDKCQKALALRISTYKDNSSLD